MLTKKFSAELSEVHVSRGMAGKTPRRRCRLGRTALAAMVETLEIRRLLTTATWTGNGGNNDWSNASDWQADAVPTTGEDVDFPDLNGSTANDVTLASAVTVGNITLDGNYSFGGSSITVDGDITASNTSDVFGDITYLTHDTTVNVGAGDQLIYEGYGVQDGGNNYGVTLTGGGTLLFTYGAEAAYGGPNHIEDGTLDNEYEVATAITVDPGATVQGNGQYDAGIVGNGGTISLGDSSSVDTSVSVPSVTFANGTTLHEELSFPSNGNVEDDGNMTVTGGTINLTGSNLTLDSQNGFTPAVGDVITLISNQTSSAVTGTFNGLPQGAIATFDGVHYQLSYMGGQSGHDVTLTVVNQAPAPTVASVMPTLVTPSARPTLSILGEDPNTNNDSDLTYTWSVARAPSGAKPVKFSENGTNAAKDATARFQKAGTYQLQCTIANSSGGSVTRNVTITIKPIATSLRLTPHHSAIAPGKSVQYAGTALDQFKHAMPTRSIRYAVQAGDGTIDDAGLFTAAEDPGHVVIQMTVDGLTGTVGATIV